MEKTIQESIKGARERADVPTEQSVSLVRAGFRIHVNFDPRSLWAELLNGITNARCLETSIPSPVPRWPM